MRNSSPYFTTARFASICPETGKRILKGVSIAYYPTERKAYHADSKAADQIRLLNFNGSYGMADANY